MSESVAIRRVHGVDFSGARDAGKKIWTTSATVSGGGLEVTDCRPAERLPGSGRTLPAALSGLRAFMVEQRDAAIGLDFPFGLPRSLVSEPTWEEFVAAFPQRYPNPEAFRGWCRLQADGKEWRRETDVEARTPFNAYNLWIFHQTYHGIARVLAPLVEAGAVIVVPMQAPLPGKPVLLETCPASTLSQRLGVRGAPHKRGGVEGHEARVGIVRRLMNEGVSLPRDLGTTILGEGGGNALDSLVAAFATWRALPEIAGGGRGATATDRLEGRVYF